MKLNFKKRVFTSFFLFSLIILIYNFKYLFVYSSIIFGSIAIIEFINLSKKFNKIKLLNYISNFFFISYLSIFLISSFIFQNFVHLKIIFFSILLGCIASDIGGYIIGNLIKGPKLTRISPNKTISGSLGSFVFTGLTISIFIFYYTKNFYLDILIISFMTSLSCQIGDLFFSFLKRKAKVKDTGNIFPGHGGVLDRIDGILFGVPTGYLTFIWMN